MGAVAEIFEELSYPGAGRLQKALKNRVIPFTKKQIEQLNSGETVRQIQHPPPRLDGSVASHYQIFEWAAALID